MAENWLSYLSIKVAPFFLLLSFLACFCCLVASTTASTWRGDVAAYLPMKAPPGVSGVFVRQLNRQKA